MKQKEIRKLYDFLLPEIYTKIVKNSNYIKTRKLCDELEEELKNFIGKDGYKKFENFMDEYLYLVSIENEEFFTQGFSMANKLRDESLIK